MFREMKALAVAEGQLPEIAILDLGMPGMDGFEVARRLRSLPESDGMLMLALVVASWWLRLRVRLFDSPWFLRACIGMAPLGFIAVLAGWTTTEAGRQPWTVYGLIRTTESVSPSLTGIHALITLLAYVAVYLIIFPGGAIVMARIVRAGPATGREAGSPIESGRPSGPGVIAHPVRLGPGYFDPWRKMDVKSGRPPHLINPMNLFLSRGTVFVRLVRVAVVVREPVACGRECRAAVLVGVDEERGQHRQVSGLRALSRDRAMI